MSEPLVDYQVEKHIATITFNDPKSLNAFGTPLKNQVLVALDKAEADDQVRVIILQGAGGNFSSGGDIKEMLSEGLDKEVVSTKLRGMVEGAGEVSLKLRQVHKPIIAKLEGAVAGAGMNLALTCDFRIAADNAKFVQAFVNIGLVPDAGGIYLLNLSAPYLLLLTYHLASQVQLLLRHRPIDSVNKYHLHLALGQY